MVGGGQVEETRCIMAPTVVGRWRGGHIGGGRADRFFGEEHGSLNDGTKLGSRLRFRLRGFQCEKRSGGVTGCSTDLVDLRSKVRGRALSRS